MIKEIGGDKLAEHIENAARISAEMPNEMKQAVGKGLENMILNDRPAAEQLAKNDEQTTPECTSQVIT